MSGSAPPPLSAIRCRWDPHGPQVRPAVARATVWLPADGWTYAHHPHLAWCSGRFVALWSNGRRDEDAGEQRVLVSTSVDGAAWAPAQVLAAPTRPGEVLTACGLHVHAGGIVAYVGSYTRAGDALIDVRLSAVTSTDGLAWDAPRDLGLPVIPNHGPQATPSGRLVIAGQTAFPWTDDPRGLDGWRMAGIHPDEAGFHDDPASFWGVRERQGWPVALCEAALMAFDDGRLRMLLRSTGHGFRGRLWASESRNDGLTWSAPEETAFPDCDSKFHLGRLPDGRWWHVGTPDPAQQHVRASLVLSLSRDGDAFDRQLLVADRPWPTPVPGQYKHGEYGYPHSLVHDGHWHVIVSRQKEAIEVLRVPLAELA